MSFDEVARAHVIRVLEATGWHRGQACEILGISRPRLRRMMRQFNLAPLSHAADDNADATHDED